MSNILLAQKLRELRKAHNINQDIIADYLGITRQSYSHFETGKRNPNIEIIHQISHFYNISSDTLLNFAFSELREDGSNYDADTVSSSEDLNEYLAFMNNPKNAKKLSLLSQYEKDMVYYFTKMTDNDKEEILELAKFKAKRNKRKK